MSKKMKELEAKLTLQQRTAAYLLVENELKETGEKRTYEDIAAEVGVSYKTVWSWKSKNRNFIDYKNLIADDMFSGKRDKVYGQLMKLINSPQPSVKAISLFLQREGLLTTKTQIETVGGGNDGNSDEDIAKEIADLDDLLKDE